MSLTTHIEEKLRTTFAPEHLDLRNESHQHSVPTNSETHFNLIIVSAARPCADHEDVDACRMGCQECEEHLAALLGWV